MKIDPTITWKAVEEAWEKETRPRQKQILGEVRDHMKTEVCGELDLLMDTLTAEPIYHTYGMGPSFGPKGYDEVRAFYEGLIASGGTLFAFDVQRIFADENGVITEGILRNCYGGEAVAAMGITEVNGEPVDTSAKYGSEIPLLTVWPADEAGKLIGEDIYFGGNAFENLTKLTPDEEPQPIAYADVK